MQLPVLLLVFVAIISQHPCEALYEGYQVWRLQQLKEKATGAIINFVNQNKKLCDVWKIHRDINAIIDVLIAPQGLRNLTMVLRQHKIAHTVLMYDLNKVIQEVRTQPNQHRYKGMLPTGLQSENATYQTELEISEAVDNYAKQYSFVKMEVLGHTVEGRPLKGLRISKNTSKPFIWIDAGMHAREWIAPASALYVIDKLLTEEGQVLLRDYQFYIVPLVNPDGYNYTHTTDRLWRKNRSPNVGKICMGVDLNRNFPLKWGYGKGSSHDACDEDYRGVGPASEPESKAMISKLVELKDQMVLYLNLHSYGQQILTPFGYARSQYPENYENMMSVGLKIVNEILARHGYGYQVGSVTDKLYEASGIIVDYAGGELGVSYTYSIELSDMGQYGFLLPPSFIPTVGSHMWTALKMFAAHI